MRVLITGATGFVGANLVEAVTARGWIARALRRKTSSLKALEGLTYESAIGDVTEPDALREAMRDVDAVFHVAAVADYWRLDDVSRMMHVNVEGTRNVLAAAREAGVKRVVFTSSVAALGTSPNGAMLNETAQFTQKPEAFYYGWSKVLAERVAAEFVQNGLDVVTVNPVVVLGPRDVNLISGSIILEAAKMIMPFVPPGGVCMIDVADVCAGHIAAFEKGRAGERYILGGDNLSYREIIQTVTKAVGGRFIPITPPRGVVKALAAPVRFGRTRLGLKLPVDDSQIRNMAETLWFDSGKARHELGLVTRPFAETVARTRDWYAANGYMKIQSR